MQRRVVEADRLQDRDTVGAGPEQVGAPHPPVRRHHHDRLRLVDRRRGRQYPAREAIDRLSSWTAPVRAELGIELGFGELNGAQRQRQLIEAGATREEVFAATVEETRHSYAQEVRV